MAEGLICQAEDDCVPMEDLGVDCFNELLSRCFFQPSSNLKLRFQMHNLINDLAQDVAAKICFNLENVNGISKSTRHLSLMCSLFDAIKKFEVCDQMEQLRTFLVLPNNVVDEKKCYLSAKVIHDLLPKLKNLRVLSLSFYEINELPDSIGDLKYLRYLNLSHTTLKRLPETISGLYNLQSLILRNCQKLTKLPTGIANLSNLRHLDISDSIFLEDMPQQIGNLKNLQTLPRFVLSEGNGSRIKELKNLLNLQGKLSILRLENVVDPRDAANVNLKGRPKIEELAVEWSDGIDGLRKESDETKVLEWLQPHQSLKKLMITGYGGSIFPNWVGDPLYLNVVQVRLIDCKNNTALPPLGRLPLLKQLEIKGMNNIESIGNEFYGESVKPFQSLEYLKLAYIPNWRDWVTPESGEENEGVFPCLRELQIIECPKLNNLPHQLSSLVKLHVEGCQELTILIPRFQSLTHLVINRCKEGMFESGVVDMPSLNTLIIKEISKPICIWEGLAQPLLAIEVLLIAQCDELGCLEGLKGLGGLRELRIGRCDGVVSLEEQGLPSNLGSMIIMGCSKLEKLPKALHNLTSLTVMGIEKCPRLVSFPKTGLPAMLSRLIVKNCEALETLPDGIMTYNCALEALEIEECPSLVGFPRGELPTTLRTLYVKCCDNLESLPEGIMRPTCHLERLEVWGCSSLKSIPRGDSFPSTLKFLVIWKRSELESIPGRMLQNLTSLSILALSNCPDVMSASLEPFSAPNLKELAIENEQNQVKTPLSAGGFHNTLPSLEKIIINGPFPDVISLTDDWFCLLPASLTLLSISDFANLKSISSIGLQTLSSLKILKFSLCPNLRSSVPKEGLPPTLECLEIWGCLILEKNTLKDKGKDWPKIAHIPCVKVDDIVQQ